VQHAETACFRVLRAATLYTDCEARYNGWSVARQALHHTRDEHAPEIPVSSENGPSKLVLRIEDALIVLCLLAFMAVAIGYCSAPEDAEQEIILWRNTSEGRVALGVLLAVLLVVFVRRFLRVRRAFKELQE
jgi:hypothetical protein